MEVTLSLQQFALFMEAFSILQTEIAKLRDDVRKLSSSATDAPISES